MQCRYSGRPHCVPYCPRCGTALSSHEVAQGYKDIEDASLHFLCPLVGEDGELDPDGRAFLAWTTTPWTLPANQAVSLNPELDYVVVQCDGVAEHGPERLVIADAMLQQILTRPAEYDIVATLNLNGDYISDALAAQVGGIGIAPGGNINYQSGHAIFEATHGTAPKYAGQDKVNPGSVVLSGEMMLRYLGWAEAAELILRGVNGAIGARTVTYDFHRLLVAEGTDATLVKCSEFGDAVIEHMK